MSQMNLLGESFFKMPSIPNLNHTLLFIQTHKYFAPSSSVSLDQNVPQQPEDPEESEISIQHKLEQRPNDIHTATSITKKKKTGCTCKKTKCLKMYCECFRDGKMCSEECSCQGCSNDHHHMESVSRARENIQHKLQSSSKQHQKGCNCKKSNCQKKYCQCFNAGVPCGPMCRCQDCMNGMCLYHQNSSDMKSIEEGIPDTISIPQNSN